MLKLFTRPARDGLSEVLHRAQNDLLLASPFIKVAEARWVCEELAKRDVHSSIHLQILTDVRSENVLNGSLDIQALVTFSELLNNTIVVNLPRIHAKVYVADTSFALVTSANLTPSGMGTNLEYGVGLDDPSTVGGIRKDLQSYARLGNILDLSTLTDLNTVADDISKEFRKLQRQANRRLRKRFTEKLRTANYEFLRAQVGSRSAHSLFSDAILYVLALGPLPTKDLHPRIQRLLPDLCDDSTELVINGQYFGKKWKHSVRNAQQYLKRSGQIQFDGKYWMLSRP